MHNFVMNTYKEEAIFAESKRKLGEAIYGHIGGQFYLQLCETKWRPVTEKMDCHRSASLRSHVHPNDFMPSQNTSKRGVLDVSLVDMSA